MISCNLCAYFYSGEWHIWSKCVNAKHSVYFITLIRLLTCTVQNVINILLMFIVYKSRYVFYRSGQSCRPNVFCVTCITLCNMSDWDFPLRCNPSTQFFSVDLKKKNGRYKIDFGKKWWWVRTCPNGKLRLCVCVCVGGHILVLTDSDRTGKRKKACWGKKLHDQAKWNISLYIYIFVLKTAKKTKKLKSF